MIVALQVLLVAGIAAGIDGGADYLGTLQCIEPFLHLSCGVARGLSPKCVLHRPFHHSLEVHRAAAVHLRRDVGQFCIIHHGHHHCKGNSQRRPQNIDAGEQLFLAHHGESLSKISHIAEKILLTIYAKTVPNT